MINKLIYNEGNLFITFDSGEIIRTTNVSKETALEISLKKDLDYLTTLKMLNLFVEEIANIEKATFLEGKLTEDSRFYYKDNSFYRTGIPLSIPIHLAEKIARAIESGNSKEVDKLDNFWKLTSLIRNAKSRESFFNYCEKNNLPITDKGCVIAFRRAKYKGASNNPAFVKWITQEYLRLRKNKKSTSVSVFQKDSEYSLKGEVDNYIGDLNDIYRSFSNVEEYFESITKDEKGVSLIYRIGEETRMKESECDFSNAECSRGIHISHGNYSFSGYGDTSLAVAFLPSDVVHCPYQDHTKMRVMAITPICVLDKDCEFEITPEINEMVDEMYSNYIDRVGTLLSTSDFEEFKQHTIVKDLSSFTSILKTLVSPNVVKTRYTNLETNN